MSDSLLWFNTQIPKEILDNMVRDLKFFDKEFDRSVIWDEDKESSSLRKSQNAWIPTSHWISGFLWHYIRMANNRNFHYDLTCIDNHQLQYTCYEKGSYYTWHTDGGVDHTILTPTGSDSWGENPKQLIDDQILKMLTWFENYLLFCNLLQMINMKVVSYKLKIVVGFFQQVKNKDHLSFLILEQDIESLKLQKELEKV